MSKKRAKKNKQKNKQDVNVNEMIAMYDELDELKAQHPDIVAQVNPKLAKPNLAERLLNFYIAVKERFHKETLVNRTVYCWLCLLGILGIHQFYARHWIKGLVYLAICWSGISAGMSIIDWMVAFPKKPDENGKILI